MDTGTSTAIAEATDLLGLQSVRELDRLLSSYRTFRLTYRDDPAGFVQDCIRWEKGEGPTDYQLEILSHIPTQRRISVRGPHSLGKTAVASWTILWFALSRDEDTDWKIPVTASAWRQLSKFLFPELRKWIPRLRWDKIGYDRPRFAPKTEEMALSIRLRTGEAFALASDTPALIEGAHASSLLFVFDESKTIPDAIWDAAEGALASGDCYALAISTPGEPVGRFYEIHSRKPGLESWWVRHVTKDEAISAGRMDADWAEQRRRQWGEGSPLYQNRVLGEFAEQLADGVIPLAYVERAQDRWREWEEAGFPGTFTGLGVDVGGGTGGDPSALARCYDKTKIQSIELRAWERDPTVATMSLTGRIKGILDANNGYAIIDGIGMGAGVVHRGREQGADFRSFIASSGTTLTDQTGEVAFANSRAALWWLARELLADPVSSVCLPPDEVADPSGETSLLGELIAPKWKELSNGRILVESKEEIRKRLGRSTNLADACLQVLTGPRVMGSFEAPSVGNLADEMAKVRAQVEAELLAEGIGREVREQRGHQRVGAAIASEVGAVATGMATLRYIGEFPSLTIFLDRRPYLVDPGWEREVDIDLAREVAKGLPHLFEIKEGEMTHAIAV